MANSVLFILMKTSRHIFVSKAKKCQNCSTSLRNFPNSSMPPFLCRLHTPIKNSIVKVWD